MIMLWLLIVCVGDVRVFGSFLRTMSFSWQLKVRMLFSNVHVELGAQKRSSEASQLSAGPARRRPNPRRLRRRGSLPRDDRVAEGPATAPAPRPSGRESVSPCFLARWRV